MLGKKMLSTLIHIYGFSLMCTIVCILTFNIFLSSFCKIWFVGSQSLSAVHCKLSSNVLFYQKKKIGLFAVYAQHLS